MSGDLPIYSDSIFRRANPFPALDGVEALDLEPCFERFDRLFDQGEGAANVREARLALNAPDKEGLVAVHQELFRGRPGAGRLRQSSVAVSFPGQDCPLPPFIARSLENLEKWLQADSFMEIHPIPQTALVLVRLLDIWPFEYGNRTAAVIFANAFMVRAGYPPFFVLPDQVPEFDQVLAAAIQMRTEPLVQLIYQCVERELNLVRQ